MAKVDKETAFMVSSGGTNFHYANRKNKKKFKGEKKLKLKKYDPALRKRVLFEEKKTFQTEKKDRQRGGCGTRVPGSCREKVSIQALSVQPEGWTG